MEGFFLKVEGWGWRVENTPMRLEAGAWAALTNSPPIS